MLNCQNYLIINDLTINSLFFAIGKFMWNFMVPSCIILFSEKIFFIVAKKLLTK